MESLLNVVYRSPALLWLFKLAKAVVRLATGTSELYRLCSPPSSLQSPQSSASASRTTTVKHLGTGNSSSTTTTTTHHHHLLSSSSKDAAEVVEYHELVDSSFSSSSSPASTSSHVSPLTIYRIDRAIFYSKHLHMERRIIESNIGDIESTIKGIMDKKLFNKFGRKPTSNQAFILRHSISIICASFKLVLDLNARAATKYDSTNKAHEKKLLDLWDLLMPQEKLTGKVSEQWKQIGFQGTDPATDFRGMGLLGLDDLFYFAKNYTADAHRVLESSHHSTAWFSMAIVGINITSFALQLVRTRQAQYYFYVNGPTKNMYHELYCYLFITFEKCWSKAFYTTPTLSVMDFNRVFSTFQTEVQRDLLEKKILGKGVSPAIAASTPLSSGESKKDI